jgi:hypothetical protein
MNQPIQPGRPEADTVADAARTNVSQEDTEDMMMDTQELVRRMSTAHARVRFQVGAS